jgi:hypothetical protein
VKETPISDKKFLPGWGIEPSTFWSKVLFYLKTLITFKIQLKNNQTEKLNKKSKYR